MIRKITTAEAIAAIPDPTLVDSTERRCAWGLFRALANIPCTCQHNVPYAGCSEPQFVTVQCGRCAAIVAWLELQPQERVTIAGAST